MVIATGVTVVTILSGGVAAAAGAAVGATAGASGAAAAGTGAMTAGAAAGAAVGAGTAGGAIAGASAAGTAVGAGIGAVTGGTATAGVGGASYGLGTVFATVGTGGWGLLAIGTSVTSGENRITYDCWKPVVHDTSVEPSNGMLLKDMVGHAHITNVTITPGAFPELPNIVLENIWNETFEIEYLLLHETGKIVGHAKRVCV